MSIITIIIAFSILYLLLLCDKIIKDNKREKLHETEPLTEKEAGNSETGRTSFTEARCFAQPACHWGGALGADARIFVVSECAARGHRLAHD